MPPSSEVDKNYDIIRLTSELIIKANSLLDKVEAERNQKNFEFDIPISAVNLWRNRPRISAWQLPKKDLSLLLISLPEPTRQLVQQSLNPQNWQNPVTLVDPARVVIFASNKELLEIDPRITHPSPILTSISLHLTPKRIDIPDNLTWTYSTSFVHSKPILISHESINWESGIVIPISWQEHELTPESLSAFNHFLTFASAPTS
jgi:hypothetical protein